MNPIEALAKFKAAEFIRLVFTDLRGDLREVELSSSQAQKVIDGEVMFDGSSVEGFSGIENSDLYLVPDLNTIKELPSKLERGRSIVLVICDIYSPSKEPDLNDSRVVLKKTLERAKELGFVVNVGAEPEFFLLKEDRTPADDARYFELSTSEDAEDCRRDIVKNLESLEFNIETSHHEVAPGQHEVNFTYSEALKAADNIQIFKSVVKRTSKQHSLNATFMAKPIQGVNGSGMHCNISLFKNGENIFKGDKEQLSLTAKQFIAGVLKYARSLAAITNPTVNSYKRLVPGYEAPVYVAWSSSNRSCMVRVPASTGNATRIEVRNPDPTSNPYLTLAVLIDAGIKGITEGLEPPLEQKENLFKLSIDEVKRLGIEILPEDLREAVNEFKQNYPSKEILGDNLFASIIKSREKDWNEYRLAISKWELDRYM
ncbi:glutamine synthetase family protein [Bacillus toyonensis]|uniref:glutamine synthetase family protein n=1 Tax=Bacillus toyonensis TaxID=155322 RepID=UPI002E21B748|nr:glutamine synthetase family protein [Bacillus toyonensis]